MALEEAPISNSTKAGVAPIWRTAATIHFDFRRRQDFLSGIRVKSDRHRQTAQRRQIRAVQTPEF